MRHAFVGITLSLFGCATAVVDDATMDAGTPPPTEDAGCAHALHACGNACVDFSHDDANCGACGKTCGPHFACTSSTCKQTSCADGTIDCSNGNGPIQCVDTSSDVGNCGACGNACGNYGVCTQGKCAIQCPQGLTACGGDCLDLTSDDANCGACNNACPKPSKCSSGTCDCGKSLTLCTNACVDLSSAQNDCGKCGNACMGKDACLNGQCAPSPSQSVVFVSSTVVVAGNIGGLSGADAICQSLAQGAGLSGNFKAWLSDSVTDAASRFAHWSTPYVLPGGAQVASNWTQLVSGSVSHAIDQTESKGAAPKGSMGNGLVWTNTNSNGTKYISLCSDWTSTSGVVNNWHFGNAAKSTASWTLDTQSLFAGSMCSQTAALYCIQN
jgi:hypothetical protein